MKTAAGRACKPDLFLIVTIFLTIYSTSNRFSGEQRKLLAGSRFRPCRRLPANTRPFGNLLIKRWFQGIDHEGGNDRSSS